MEFGKVTNIDAVDFTLPPDHPDNQSFLATIKPNKKSIYIGGTGWVEKSFIGKIYPEGCKSKDYLKYYSQSFNTIEFNSTYYAIPKKETVLKWKNKVTDDFVFCPKVPYEISHELELVKAQDATKLFLDCIFHWEQNLGVAFLVLPPHFSVNKRRILQKYVEQLPNNFDLAIEFRHPSWFNLQNKDTKETFLFLQDYQVGMVITDVAGRRDCLHQRLTTDFAFVRFVGNNLHSSDEKRLDDWVKKIHLWFQQGLNRMYFFIHQYDGGLTVETTTLLVSKLKQQFPGLFIQSPSIIKQDIQQTFF